MPKGTPTAVDKALDSVNEIRTDLYSLSGESETRITAVLHELVKVLNATKATRAALADDDSAFPGGGEMYQALDNVRQLPAIRNARRRQVVEREPVAA